MEVSRGFVDHLALILSHHSAKFGVHRPYETGNNGVCNIISNSNSNSNAEIPMPRFTMASKFWLVCLKCDISAELMSICFSRPKFNAHFENHGQSGWLGGVSEIYAHLFTIFIVKQHMGKIIRKSCLMFPEQDQSPKTNLRMFKFDNKLIWKRTLVRGITWAHKMTPSHH